MGWINNGRYFQRTLRKNGRARLHYYGKAPFGLLGEFTAWEDAQERAEQRERIEQQERLIVADQRRFARIKALLVTFLKASGFQRLRRNPWTKTTMPTLKLNGHPPRKPNEVRTKIRALIGRVADHEPAAITELVAIGQRYPAELSEEIGFDLAQVARSAFVEKLSPDAAGQDEYLAQMALEAHKLAGENPSLPVQRCAEVAAFAWVDYWRWAALTALGGNSRVDALMDKRQTNAHMRYVRSLKELEQIKAAQLRPRRMVDWFGKTGS